VTRPIRPRVVFGSQFFFVFCKPDHFFGVEEHWVTKTEKVRVSDLERTVIDGLKLPEHCGGVSEVAKGIWIRREDLSVDRLSDYAFRLDIGAVIRRLGFLLETFSLGSEAQISRLRKRLTSSYAILDPVLPDEGGYSSRWKLRLNIEAQELLSLIRT
jgi:predicted transcriptional regulator of viral defense system